MIFHATPLSSYSAKVRIVLCVKGIDFEEQPPSGGYRTPAYRAIVPMGTVPAIQEGTWVLSESEAINEYLEERYPQPAMLPRDLRLRARSRFLGRFHDIHLEPRVRALFPHLRPQSRHTDQVATLRAEIAARIDQLDAWATEADDGPWMLGPRIGLADCGPVVTLALARDTLAACGQPLELPLRLRRMLDAAAQEPAVQRALAPWRSATDTWLKG